MSTKYEFLITDQGLEKRTITSVPIDINQAIIEQISATAAKVVPRIFPMKFLEPEADSFVGAVFGSNGASYWTMPIEKLPLKTFFQAKDGELWPVFDDSTSPMLSLEWRPPANCYLRLVVSLTNKNACMEQHLIAFDTDGRPYKMPLSNLYDDCRLCHGKYTDNPITHAQALAAALKQFREGNWNADLYGGSAEKRKKTKAMFTFKAEKDGFNQGEPNANWTVLCDRVSTAFITSNVINPATQG